jgi:large conductance mechanosensitive channel
MLVGVATEMTGKFQGSERAVRGFKNFLMRGDVIIVAVGLVVALAFSGLISAFTTDIINPLVNRAQGGKTTNGLGVQLGAAGNAKTFLDFGAFVSAIVYFVVFMAVVYFLIVVPYRHIQARRGQTVFGEPAPVKTCPYCLSTDLPAAASKCKYCGSAQPSAESEAAPAAS